MHLIRAYPNANVKLFDREPYPCQLGASWDWNKIIRAEYTDLFYMKLALEAKKWWKEDPLWKPFYHQPGGVWIQDSDLANEIRENYSKLGMDADVKTYSVEEAKSLYGGMFKHAEFEGINRVLVSSTAGWAEAGKALAATIDQAVKEGVRYVQGNVRSLAFDEASCTCVGVKTAAEETIKASKVILCTGAGTARLLADSAPKWTELHAGKRWVASGMCTALMMPEPKACARFKDVPITLHERVNYEGRGGFIPPTPDGNFKWWADITFSNYTMHEASGEEISMPPSGPYQGQWDVPKAFHREMYRAKEVIFGSTEDDFTFDKFRLCWDAQSPSDDWFLTPHPASTGLYLATIGSWHSYKFLPTVGKYVVQMLEGKLDEEQQKRWAWDRELQDTSDNQYWPKRDWKDIVKATKL